MTKIINDWISVEDEMPDEYEGKILICYGQQFFGHFVPEVEVGYYEDGIWRFWMNNNTINTDGVTHWKRIRMPDNIEKKRIKLLRRLGKYSK